ncbi:hypothetical protein [Geminisphaera colitermitum]|uniref:hypothetical protein n=1 Tax=Geminisphaera colitermitum TaxID=1148786 RepID=UPI000158C513|nr:hypothetical protein [Geminisphaera colitermitum]
MTYPHRFIKKRSLLASCFLASLSFLHASPPPPPPAGTGWENLPTVNYEQRNIDGQTWTEGLSKLAIGRFAVNAVNGLMNETVADYSFYKSQYDMFSYSGFPRDYFDIHIPDTNGVPTKDSMAGDWSHQIRTRDYKGGRSVKFITGSAAPGFLVETNASNFTLTKREGDKDRVDWRGTIPEHERRGVFPLLVLVPREGNKVELVTRERGDWNSPMSLGKPAQPWIVAVYPPVSRQFLWNFKPGPGSFVQKGELWEFPNYIGDDAVAVLMTFRDGLELQTQFGELTLVSTDQKEIGTVGLSTAFDGLLKDVRAGLKEINPHPGDSFTIAESMEVKWQSDKWNVTPVAQRAAALAKLLHTYPLSTREWFRVEAQKAEVKIRNEFTYHRWGNPEWQSADYAPIPAAFALSHKELGWPILAGVTDPRIRGRLGPFLYFANQNACEWNIPLGQPEYALQPAMSGQEKDVAPRIVAEYVADETFRNVTSPTILKGEQMVPGTQAYYDTWKLRLQSRYLAGLMPWGSFRMSMFAPWSVLDDARREALVQRLKTVLRFSFHHESYFRKSEPITGHPYANSAGSIEKPNYMAGDVPSYMAPIYYGYLYAKFSGDWEWISQYYRESWDITRFAEIYADWAWPGVSLREHIFVTHFDPMICGALTFMGLERMSDVLGTRAEHERAQYLLSRTSASLVTQSLLPRWVDPETKNPALTCDGASEHGPMLLDFELVQGRTRMQRSMFAYAWLGNQSELFRYREQLTGPTYWKNYQQNFVGSKKWDWKQDFAIHTQYAMRAWLRDWPHAELVDYSDDATKGLSSTLKGGKVDVTVGTKSRTQYAPTNMLDVHVLLLSRKYNVPAFLVNWEPGKIAAFSWDESTGQLSLKIEMPKAGQIVLRSWNTLPASTLVNGASVVPAAPVILPESIPAGRKEAPGEMGPLFAVPLPSGTSEVVMKWTLQK